MLWFETWDGGGGCQTANLKEGKVAVGLWRDGKGREVERKRLGGWLKEKAEGGVERRCRSVVRSDREASWGLLRTAPVVYTQATLTLPAPRAERGAGRMAAWAVGGAMGSSTGGGWRRRRRSGGGC